MNILAVVTPLSIYHSCSTWKTFWEEKFSGEEKFTLGDFTPVNMKNCGRHNVRKHKDTRDSDKYINLDILLKFGSIENIIITSSYPKDYLGKSRKGLITSLGLKEKLRPER